MSEKELWLRYRTIHKLNPNPDSEAKVDFYRQNSENIRKANMEASPKLAVVIPAYNEQNFLPRTLAGINKAVAESGEIPIEVLVVDNNSNDGTADIAMEFGAKVVEETRKGIGYARQAGLEAVLGSVENILTTDADTVVSRQWIQRHNQGLNENGVSFTYGRIEFLPDKNLGVREKISLMSYTLIAELIHEAKNMRGVWVAGAANTGFRKEAAIQVGGYKIHLCRGEDTDLMTRISEHGRVKRVNNANVLTSARRVVGKGVWQHGIERLKDNIVHVLTRKVATSETYQDFRA